MGTGVKNKITVKELYKKYKGYNIMLFGVSLKKPSTPFTRLPKNKKLDDCIVQELKVEEEKVESLSFSLDLKYKGKAEYKGTVCAYVK